MNQSTTPTFSDHKPDAWIYNYAVLKWMFEPSLATQLPWIFSPFRIYSYWYFKLIGQTYLKGGRALFRFLSNLQANISPQPDLKINLPNFEIYVDPSDARFFQVVNELTNPQSDLQILSQLLSEGDTFIDIGANHGSFSIAASKLVGASGRIIAVEAQPHLAKIVEKSLSINALSEFKVYPVALGNIDGDVTFLIPLGTSGSAGIFAEHSATDRFKSIKVPIKRMDDLIEWQGFTGKILLKLDIEGSESSFLLGASDLIKTLKPMLIIEIHPETLKAAKTNGDNLKVLLADLGFQSYAEIDNLKVTFPLVSLNTDLQRNVILYQNVSSIFKI